MKRYLLLLLFVTVAVCLLCACGQVPNDLFGESNASGSATHSGDPTEDPSDISVPDPSGSETSSEPEPNPFEGLSVILDPGHGFRDGGCVFPNGVAEKEVTLQLTMKLKETLEQDGVTVLLTHDGSWHPIRRTMDDRAQELGYDFFAFLTELQKTCTNRTDDEIAAALRDFDKQLDNDDYFWVHERCYQAVLLSAEQVASGQKKPSLFLSLHVNSFDTDSSVNGIRLYDCKDALFPEENLKIINAVKDAVDRAMLSDSLVRVQRYAWDDGLVVNKYVDIPSVLIESGFATNPTDAQNMQDPDWQAKFARTVADALEAYLLA